MIPSRRPAITNGTAAGRMTLVKRNRSPAVNDLAISTRFRSTSRTPVWVLMMIGKTPPSTTRAMFEVTPIPRIRISTGSRATAGVEYSAMMYGSTVRRTSRYRPITSPIGIPITTDNRNPIARVLPLNSRSG